MGKVIDKEVLIFNLINSDSGGQYTDHTGVSNAISDNADSTIALFKQIEEKNQFAEQIFIIADNARYYRSESVTEYLKNSKIKLVFLPPYSPNLNLIERLWRFLHKKIQYNKYYETFLEFKNACIDLLNNLHKYEKELKSLLTENFEIIGNAFT